MDFNASLSGSISAPQPRFDAAALIASALQLQRAGDDAATHALLRGKNLGLVCAGEEADDARLFRHAAVALGARVTRIRPDVSAPDASNDGSLRPAARILGRLYDGIECQGLDPAAVSRLRREAGIPVFDGLASSRHSTASLAGELAGTEPAERKRLLILQAALLSSLLDRPPSGT